MNTDALIHCTSSRSALASILQNGLLYRYNSIELMEQINGPLGFGLKYNPAGMICFTDLPLESLGPIVAFTGPYGVAVSKEWALSNGARKVRYVDARGPEMDELRRLFGALKPSAHFDFPDNHPDNAYIQEWVEHLGASKRTFATSLGASPEFLKLLERLDESQTDLHMAESEWRMRSTIPGEFHQDDHIATALQIVRAHPDFVPAFGLRIPPLAIEFLFCPATDENLLKGELAETDFRFCEVRSYPP